MAAILVQKIGGHIGTKKLANVRFTKEGWLSFAAKLLYEYGPPWLGMAHPAVAGRHSTSLPLGSLRLWGRVPAGSLPLM